MNSLTHLQTVANVRSVISSGLSILKGKLLVLNEYPARLICLLIRLFKLMDFLSETDDSNLMKTTNS